MFELTCHGFLPLNEYLLQGRLLPVPFAYHIFAPASRDTTASVGTQDQVEYCPWERQWYGIVIHTTSWEIITGEVLHFW